MDPPLFGRARERGWAAPLQRRPARGGRHLEAHADLTLKTLEENGLVKRTAFPTVPPRVDYELTPIGRTLIRPLKALLDWSLEHRDAMAEARRAHGKVS